MKEELSNIDKALLLYLKKNYNIEPDSPLYKAAVILIQRLWQGSICVSFNELKNFIPYLQEDHIIKTDAVGLDNEVRPLIFNESNLYIQRYFEYQKRIIKKIKILEENDKLKIITGGPGTGKTTSLAEELIKIIKKDNINTKKILLAAPTGKAAFRMNEALGKSLTYDEKKPFTHWLKSVDTDIIKKLKALEAKTIHRLLGTRYLSVNFKHNKDNTLDADIIVIDECSMVDLPMMAKLLDAIREGCFLFLVGDKNQLASIEAGSVFADICLKYNKPQYADNGIYKEKVKNFRAAEAPGILKLSEAILNENVKSLDNENVKYFKELSFNDLLSNYADLIKAKTPKDALITLEKFQILCSIKKGKNGTFFINKELLKRVKKERAKFTPIIINENNYSLKLYNGDVGVKDDEYAYFLNQDDVSKFTLLNLPDFSDAFAITIHKSQGSEYNKIAVIYPDSEKEEEEGETIFTKELLYTAVTRAKKECLIFGSEKVILDSCRRHIYRASGII